MDIGVWILAALIVAFVGFFAVSQVRAAMPNLMATPRKVSAEVAALRRLENTGSGWEPSVRCLAVFRIEDGEVREYEVSEDTFRTLTEGTKGTLRVRGAWFLGFNPSA